MRNITDARSAVFSDKWFLFAIIALLFSVYFFSIKPTKAVQACHNTAQASAKNAMQARAQQSPENPDFQRALQAGMFVDQDYVTFYRNCIRTRGYTQ
ncbi:hypothetical protein COU76_04220 [Candidatus Peregrinibacteria bacterium CG10_big_fil_rev_8_21_14_0_10_49_10]|nr:MAG: hypothetical protein COU76_04220 [Candidatus Peregrinibacteria bacterium CG10_big_fil_rev_8_21_14_0_10_49_10]